MRGKAVTGNIDCAPTMLALAGVSIPDNIDGRSLVPLLENPDQDVRDHMACMNCWGEDPIQAMTVVTKRWKYTYWWYSDDRMEASEDLFDTENDPLELVNLVDNPAFADALQEMRLKYDAEHALLKANAVPYNDYAIYKTRFERK